MGRRWQRLKPPFRRYADFMHCGVCSDQLSWIQHVADHKVPYKRLAGGVEFIDAIPKNPSGKLLRRVLRDKAMGMREGQPAAKARL